MPFDLGYGPENCLLLFGSIKAVPPADKRDSTINDWRNSFNSQKGLGCIGSISELQDPAGFRHPNRDDCPYRTWGTTREGGKDYVCTASPGDNTTCKGVSQSSGEYPKLLQQTLDPSYSRRTRYLSKVRDVTTAHPQSLHVIRTDPRYRETLRALDVLKWGLVAEMSGRATRISLKDTWQLYEYWVFMYVLDLLRTRGWEEVEQGVVTTNPRGELVVSLRHEDTHAHFKRENTDTGEVSEVIVTFHKGFVPKGTRTVPTLGALTVKRDVDIMLAVNRGNEFRRYVLDPKYRVEVTSDGCRVCPTSAIDDMHVYRDAIGRWVPRPGGGLYFERILQGAFAIFPSRDEECYREHMFVQRLDDGIGAVPLLPSAPPLEMFAELVDRLCS